MAALSRKPLVVKSSRAGVKGMDSNFCIRVTLRSAIIVGRYPLTADGWLAGVEFERTLDHEYAINSLPFATWQGVPMASQIIPGYMAGPPEYGSVTYYTQPARDLQFDIPFADYLDRDPTINELTDSRRGRGDLAAFGNTYQTALIREVFFACRGDMRRTEEILLATDGSPIVPTLGPQRSKGHGHIETIEIQRMPADNRLYGLIGRTQGANVVLRPIPTRLRRELPDASGATMERTWKNPYRPIYPEAVVEDCLVPPFQRGTGFRLPDLRRFAQGR